MKSYGGRGKGQSCLWFSLQPRQMLPASIYRQVWSQASVLLLHEGCMTEGWMHTALCPRLVAFASIKLNLAFTGSDSHTVATTAIIGHWEGPKEICGLPFSFYLQISQPQELQVFWVPRKYYHSHKNVINCIHRLCGPIHLPGQTLHFERQTSS